VQPLNTFFPILVTVLGIIMDCKEVQSANASS